MMRSLVTAFVLVASMSVEPRRAADQVVNIVDGVNSTAEAARLGYYLAVACERQYGDIPRIPFDSIQHIVFPDSAWLHPGGIDPATRQRHPQDSAAAYSAPAYKVIFVAGPYRDNQFVWAHETEHIFHPDTTPETYHVRHRECGL